MTTTDTALSDAVAAWRRDRHAAVTGPSGNLALATTAWLTPEPREIPGVPGQWHDDDGAVLTIAAADGAFLDDQVIDGSVRLRSASSDRPSRVRFTRDAAGRPTARELTATVIGRRGLESGLPEVAVRIWDAGRAAALGFDRIDAFEVDPSLVIEAAYEAVDGERLIPFEHIRDAGRRRGLVVPGDIRATIRGQEFTLQAFDDGDKLILVFADATNGADSYASGRFLFVTPSEDGRVVLDFNRAIVPPCGFSDQYNCPLPPAANRFPFRIEAGEKRAILRPVAS